MTADITALKSTPEALLIASGASPAKRADIFIESSPDALDETQFATQRDLAVTLLKRETKMRRRVERALRRTEDGSSGICLGCDEPISAKAATGRAVGSSVWFAREHSMRSGGRDARMPEQERLTSASAGGVGDSQAISPFL